MLYTFIKIIFLKEKKYLFFIFLSVVLSIFSYILGNNIVLGVKEYLKEQVKPLIGGDLVITHNSKIDFELFSKYAHLFKKAETIEIDSTLFDANNKPMLYEFVYTSPEYPLYDTFSYDVIDPDGLAIVDQATYEMLGATVEIFGEPIKVKALINKKPLGEISLYTNDKKIYLPIETFNSTLDETNSRIQYKIYLNFLGNYDEQIVNSLKSIASQNRLRLTTINDRQQSIGEITDRFYFFINGFYLVIFVLTFFIVIISLESFFKKNKSNFGLLNIFGMTKTKIFLYSFGSLFLIFLGAFLTAFVLNLFTLNLLNQQVEIFDFHSISMYQGGMITCVLLGVGIFSPYYKIFKSHILELLKDTNEFSNFGKKDYFIYLLLIFFAFFLINLISGIELVYSLIFTLGALCIVILFYLGVNFVLKVCFEVFGKKIKNFYLFDSLRSPTKPGNVSFLIVFSGIISFLSIFVFFVFSGSFLTYLLGVTSQSNDMFVINIGNEDLQKIKSYFNQDEIYEIVNARISTINGKTLAEHLKVETVSREFSREFFSTTNTLNNTIVAGKPLSPSGVSVDEGFASRLGLSLGDTIVFDVSGLEKELIIVNFREALRSGTNPFFYFMFDQQDFVKYPKTYILSYKQSEKPDGLEVILAKETSGNLIFLDTKDIIEIVISISQKIVQVVYFSLFYIFIFSFLSFLVSILFLKSFKDYKIQILHTLGGIKKKLILGVKFEYFYLLLVGLIFSLVFGSILLLLVFMYIDYFSLSSWYYGFGILLLIGIFVLVNIFLYFFGNAKSHG